MDGTTANPARALSTSATAAIGPHRLEMMNERAMNAITSAAIAVYASLATTPTLTTIVAMMAIGERRAAAYAARAMAQRASRAPTSFGFPTSAVIRSLGATHGSRTTGFQMF